MMGGMASDAAVMAVVEMVVSAVMSVVLIAVAGTSAEKMVAEEIVAAEMENLRVTSVVVVVWSYKEVMNTNSNAHSREASL